MAFLRGSYNPGSTSNASGNRGNLRGSRVRAVSSRSPTLSNKVRKLERQVRKLKPELKQFVTSAAGAPVGAGFNKIDNSITRSLISWSEFRDNVNGDQWVNKGLQLNIKSASGAITLMRVVVYVPLRASNVVWGPTGLTQIPDMTAFSVLYDQTFSPDFSAGKMFVKAFIKMDRLTKYNSDGDTIDRNNIRYMVMWETTSTSGDEIAVGASLYFHDK